MHLGFTELFRAEECSPVDLPTYTNIWRIEKRLYKLYDFRLPMPLPINWIAVFAGITIPYIVLLIAIGLPFNHTLVWLYVLPPGLLTWLTTRPVIENKRLPELVESQARYLAEPKTWVRLTPLSEKDRMVLTGRVWRNSATAGSRPATAARPASAARSAAALPAARQGRPERTGQVLRPTSIFRPEAASVQGTATARQAAQGQNGRPRPAIDADARPRARERARAQERAGSAGSSTRGHGQVRLAPALPASRRAPANRPAPPGAPPGPPQSSGLAAHAMPDVLPPATAPRPADCPRPTVAAQPPGIAPRPASAPQVQESRPASPVPAPVVQAPVVSQTFAPASPRVRAGGSGAAAPEVSHDGPGRRRPAEQPAAQNAGRAHWAAAPSGQGTPATLTTPPAPESFAPAGSAPAGPALENPAPPETPAPGPGQPVPPPSPVSPAPLAPQAVATPDWPVPARPLRPVPANPANPADAAASAVPRAARVARVACVTRAAPVACRAS